MMERRFAPDKHCGGPKVPSCPEGLWTRGLSPFIETTRRMSWGESAPLSRNVMGREFCPVNKCSGARDLSCERKVASESSLLRTIAMGREFCPVEDHYAAEVLSCGGPLLMKFLGCVPEPFPRLSNLLVWVRPLYLLPPGGARARFTPKGGLVHCVGGWVAPARPFPKTCCRLGSNTPLGKGWRADSGAQPASAKARWLSESSLRSHQTKVLAATGVGGP